MAITTFHRAAAPWRWPDRPGGAGQPTFGNPRPQQAPPSEKANAAADAAPTRKIAYTNRAKAWTGPDRHPGEIKSNNASFTQRFLPNNIADFAELELSQVTSPVLERTNIGPC